MRAVLALIVLALGLSAASAQNLPYHSDPTARELVPNLSAVPNIRFLTTADFPPFNYRDKSGELVGYNVDLARAVCADLTITCTIQAWPWEQAGKALEDGQGDALIAGLAMSTANGALSGRTLSRCATLRALATPAPPCCRALGTNQARAASTKAAFL